MRRLREWIACIIVGVPWKIVDWMCWKVAGGTNGGYIVYLLSSRKSKFGHLAAATGLLVAIIVNDPIVWAALLVELGLIVNGHMNAYGMSDAASIEK